MFGAYVLMSRMLGLQDFMLGVFGGLQGSFAKISLHTGPFYTNFKMRNEFGTIVLYKPPCEACTTQGRTSQEPLGKVESRWILNM